MGSRQTAGTRQGPTRARVAVVAGSLMSASRTRSHPRPRRRCGAAWAADFAGGKMRRPRVYATT